jgi:uncharacterized protein YeaO (DUF488 family)
MTNKIRFRRIYDDASADDGVRVLVDRIWPRGIRKEDAHLDEWLREAAPSTDLRKWFGHDPDRFAEFRRRYVAELGRPEGKQALQHLRDVAAGSHLTLLTASRDLEHSQAAVLAGLLNDGHGTKH